jgi:hypothetical protein
MLMLCIDGGAAARDPGRGAGKLDDDATTAPAVAVPGAGGADVAVAIRGGRAAGAAAVEGAAREMGTAEVGAGLRTEVKSVTERTGAAEC